MAQQPILVTGVTGVTAALGEHVDRIVHLSAANTGPRTSTSPNPSPRTCPALTFREWAHDHAAAFTPGV